MTRAEIRIAAARRRAKAAEAAFSKAFERQRAEREALKRKQLPLIWKAERKVREARVEVAIAELMALGITPMKTIILWHPKGYTAPSAQRRYAVSVTREGWKELLPVGKTGAILAGRSPQRGLYSSDWRKVVVTDQEIRE